MNYKLRDILSKYIRGPFGSALKRNEMKAKGIPVYEQQNAIYNHREFRFFIDDEKFNELKRFQVKPGDLIISCSGTLGKVSLIKEDDEKGIISQALLILRPNIDIVLPGYLYYFFKSDFGYESLISRSSGSVQVNLAKREIIEDIEIFVPDKEIQKKVLKLLGGIDDKINCNNKINNNLHDMIVKNYTEYLNEIDDYEVLNIKDFFNFETGVEPGSANYLEKPDNDTVKFYRVGDMNSECKTYVKKDCTNNKYITEDDIVVSFDATIGRIGYGLEGSYSTGMKKITIADPYKKIIDNSLVYAYFNDENIQNIMKENAKGTTILHASSSIDYMVFKYNEEMLKKYCPLISAAFNKMKNIKKENIELLELRDELLAKIMNNEIDISNIEI